MIADLFAKTEARSGVTNPAQWLIDYVRGDSSSSGISVSESKALGYPPIWAAVNIIAGAVGYLPFKVYRRLERGKQEQTTHPAYKLLHDRPNPYMDAMTFRETLQGHALVYGNGYAEIERDKSERPTNLWPLAPDKTTPVLTASGEIVYEVRSSSGGTTVLKSTDCLHIRGFGEDGFAGYGVVRKLAESIGVGMAAEKFGAKFFGNGTALSGVLTSPNTLTADAIARIRDTWERAHQGLDQAHRVAILENGLGYEKIGIPPEDAQFLETRKFGVNDVARIFQIPPHMLGDLDRATFSNIEHQGIEYVVHTLTRWLRRWEHECNYKLFSAPNLFTEFVVEGLLRGDSAQRATFYRQMSDLGILSVNEIRAKENLNPLDDENADKHFIQTNRAPLEDWQPQEPASEPPVQDDIRAIAERLVSLEADALGKLLSKGAGEHDIASFYGRHARMLADESLLLPGRSVAPDFTEYIKHNSLVVNAAIRAGDGDTAIGCIKRTGPDRLVGLLEQDNERH